MPTSYLGRQLNIGDYALAGFSRRLGRNIGIVLVFSLVIFLVASFSLTTTSLQESARRLLQSVPDITVQQLSAGRQTNLNEDDVAALAQIFGIKSIRPRIWGYYFDENSGANYTVIGHQGLSSHNPPAGLDITYLPTADIRTDAAQAIIGQGVQAGLRLERRRTFSLFRPDLTLKSFVVTGEFSETTSMVTDDLIVIDLADARDLFQMPKNEITDILISVANPLEIENISRKIDERLKNVRVLTRERIGKTYRVAFGWRSGFGLACLFGAVAAFFILAWDKATGLTPEQRREVAVLKVLGWQTEDVITLRFWESCIVSLLAFAIGYLAAWMHLLFFDGLLFRPVLLGWSVLRPPISLVPVFTVGDLLIIFSLSVLPYLAATVIPAWHSAAIRPDSVL